VLALSEAQKIGTIAALFRVHRTTVWRVAERFLADDIRGLRDGRSMRGPVKATPEVGEVLVRLVRASPLDFGYTRPAWTRALLAEEIEKQTGVHLSVTTVGRILARVGAGWNRPRPVVKCPWPEDKRKERLREISRMLARLPPDQIALFEDEVDLHLNPKIGFDWMMRGEQKEVVTPGQNKKKHLAGALEPCSRKLVWVRGDRKDSELFIRLLRLLARTFRRFTKVHLILDNYCIHKSKATRKVLAELNGKIELHFLPPYCPQENKIELVWLHLHRNVTSNHRCQEIEELLDRAENHLRCRYVAVSPEPQAAA
jgi:transposase